MKCADTDGNGEIDYSEWMIASVNKKSLLTKETLNTAFNLFDKDRNGMISPSEIREVLGVGKKID